MVVYHRIRQLTHGDVSAEGLALGRAIMHEIGHLLVRTEVHSPRGIMRGDWNHWDFTSPTAVLNFTAEQAEIIRAEVRARLAHASPGQASPLAVR